MTDKLTLALVGCGAISRFHLQGIAEGAPRIAITAVVDVDPGRAEAVAAQTGATPYTSLDEALGAGGFDAVDLMVPHDLHERLAVQCLEAGKHLLLEKPMAPTLDACDAILAAADEAGTVFMVAENAQYWPEAITVGRLIREGAIGEVVTASSTIVFPPLPDYYGGERAWRLDPALAGGGIAIDTGSHWLRPLRMWLGEVDEVVAATGKPFPTMHGESLVHALLRFGSGVVATFDAHLTDAPFHMTDFFTVTGSDGQLVVEPTGNVLLYNRSARQGERVGEAGGYFASYSGEFADFARAVLDGHPLAAGPESSLGELRAALAMYRSAETGLWEKV